MQSVYQEVLEVCESGTSCSLRTRESCADGEVDGTGRLFSPSAFYSYVHRIGVSIMTRQYSNRGQHDTGGKFTVLIFVGKT